MITKEQKELKKYLEMTPEEFSKLSAVEISEMLNEIVPTMLELSDKIKQLEWVFDQLKEQRLLKELRKFESKTLRYKNVLLTLIKSSYVDPRKIIKRLEQENPKIKKLIEKISEEETVTIEKIRKAYSEDKQRPKGFPDKEEKVIVESFAKFFMKAKDKVQNIWNKVVDFVRHIWMSTFSSLNEKIDEMIGNLTEVNKNVIMEKNLRKIIRKMIKETTIK